MPVFLRSLLFLTGQPGCKIGLNHVKGRVTHVEKKGVKGFGVKAVAQFLFGCLPHVHKFHEAHIVGKIIGGIFNHGKIEGI